MTDQQQIEVWRKEYESMLSESGKQKDYRDPSKYWNDPIEHQWQGFCMAKRAQKPVEITDPEWPRWVQTMYLCVRKNDCSIPDNTLEQMRAILNSYTVKGE